MSRRIVLASSNPGKLREFRDLLAEQDLEVVAQGEFGIDAIEEPHHTFLENALAKARHAAAFTGLPALADDSGLCVPALQGEPGVHSARFAGAGANDTDNNAELLRRLEGRVDRAAHYTCVLVALRTAGDPEPLVADARWSGELLHEARGAGGFGYDPLFYVRECGCSAAELPPEVKNRLSHRGQALRELALRLAAWR
jgi:XTP/dITP diphosphohydrolase